MATGIVKWFNDKKGFGFIIPDDGSDELFVHHTSIDMDGFRSIRENQAVEFEVEEGEDIKVKLVDSSMGLSLDLSKKVEDVLNSDPSDRSGLLLNTVA